MAASLGIHWPGSNNGHSDSDDPACTGDDHGECRRSTWRAMLELHEKGRDGGARAVGVSNYEPGNIEDLGSVANGDTSKLPAVNQVEFNLRFHDDALLQFCREHGITLQAYAPLHTPDKNPTPNLMDDVVNIT